MCFLATKKSGRYNSFQLFQNCFGSLQICFPCLPCTHGRISALCLQDKQVIQIYILIIKSGHGGTDYFSYNYSCQC